MSMTTEAAELVSRCYEVKRTETWTTTALVFVPADVDEDEAEQWAQDRVGCDHDVEKEYDVIEDVRTEADLLDGCQFETERNADLDRYEVEA